MFEILKTVDGLEIYMGLVTTRRSFLISAKIFYTFNTVLSWYNTIWLYYSSVTNIFVKLRTLDQAKALLKFVEAISEKTLR